MGRPRSGEGAGGGEVSRKPSPETECRYLRAELRRETNAHSTTKADRENYRIRATKAEQELAEWKRRFDALLLRTPEVKPCILGALRRQQTTIDRLEKEQERTEYERHMTALERDALLAQLAAAERDAGRYRWLRANANSLNAGKDQQIVWTWEVETYNTPDPSFDAAIDTAIASSQGDGA
jgi:hypothetical protein